jgi:hypothetical protein
MWDVAPVSIYQDGLDWARCKVWRVASIYVGLGLVAVKAAGWGFGPRIPDCWCFGASIGFSPITWVRAWRRSPRVLLPLLLPRKLLLPLRILTTSTTAVVLRSPRATSAVVTTTTSTRVFPLVTTVTVSIPIVVVAAIVVVVVERVSHGIGRRGRGRWVRIFWFHE